MAKKSPPSEQDELLNFLSTPIGVGSPVFEVPTYRDPSKDFETLQGSVDPLGGVDFEAEPDWLAMRDAEQSRWDKWANGTVKALGKLGTTAIEGVGALATIPYGIIKGASTGDWSGFYDNALGDMMDGINDSLAEAFPNYQSRRDTTFDADFWADQFLGGAGYMAGAILGGEGIGLIGKAAGGAFKASELAQLGKGAKIKDLVGSSSKIAQLGAKLKDPAKQLAYSVATATSEAAVEARDTKDVLYQDLINRRDSGDPALADKTDAELYDMSKAAGNAAFALNLPIIAGSNMVTFGKALIPGYKAAKKSFNLLGDIGSTTVKKESAILKDLKEFGEGAISESVQELSQLGISEGTKKYYLGQYSASAGYQDSLYETVFDETIKNLGTKEGLESMFLGAILGGPTSAITSRINRSKDGQRAQAYSNLLNDPAISNLISSLGRRVNNAAQVTNASVQEDQALANNDKFGFKNAEYDLIKGLTKQAQELGGAETLIDKLKALKESDLESFNKQFNITGEDFNTIEERNASIDKVIQTVKNVAEAYDNIIIERPELNPLVQEKTPELTQAKRHIFDAIFDAVTNFEDIDKREKEISSDIFKLTSDVRFGVGEMAAKEYVQNGVDYNEFRNSPDYKEAFKKALNENPFKAKQVESLVKDLFALAERREQMIKQYNEALENPEKIIKEAKEAEERFKQELAKQQEAKQKAEEAKKEKPAPTPEEMLGGEPETPVVTNEALKELSDRIAREEKILESMDPENPLYEVQSDNIADLYFQKEELTKKLSEQVAEDEKKEKKVVQKVNKTTVISEDKKLSIDNNTFTKTTSAVDKEQADKVIQTVAPKELLKNLKIVIKDFVPSKQENEFVDIVGKPVSIAFVYNDVTLGYLANDDKFITKDGQTWEQLSETDKLNYFKVKDNTTLQAIDAQQANLKELRKVLDNLPHGEYTLADLPYLEVTPMLGELDLTKPSLLSETDLPIKIEDGQPLILDQKKGKAVFDNLKGDIIAVPEKLKTTGNRYLALIDNGYEQRWIVLKPLPLSSEQFTGIFSEVLDLQRKILAGEQIPQDEINNVNDKTEDKYYVASEKDNKKYLYVRLSDKGTFSIREKSFDTTTKGEKTVKADIPTLEDAYTLLSKKNTIYGNIDKGSEGRLVAGFKNSGLRTVYNSEAKYAAPISDFVVETKEEKPVEDKKADIERRRPEIVSKYTDAQVKASPDKIYVFGDNTQRTGTGGQAQIRNNPNAFGIATKLKPTNNADAFMSDKDLEANKKVIDSDIQKILAQNKPLVFPKDGFGTGLAKLKEKAPKTYEYLKQRLVDEFYFDNDKGEINAKYNAELAALEKPKKKSIKEQAKEIAENFKKEDKFSVSSVPAKDVIRFEEAKEYLKSILPFEVADIDAIADRLTNTGETFGAFIDNVIYLNKAAQVGTEYHEAFHGVMSLFSSEEKAKYLDIAKKEHKITEKARANFLLERPIYQNYTKEELDDVIYEEYLADKFMAWKQGKKELSGLAKMFEKIKQFFSAIADYFSGNLDSLFHRIDSGRFKHRTIGASKVPYFMALPYSVEKIKGTDESIVKKLNSKQETDLINSIRASVANKIMDSLETGKVSTIRDAFEQVLQEREALYDEIASENEDLDYYMRNAGLFELEGVKETVYEQVKSQVQLLLAIDEDIETKLTSKEEEEGLRDYEKSAIQNTGLTSMSQYVRMLLATAYVEAKDEYGVTYKKGINPSVVYNSIGRTLLNTKPEDFMKKLELFSEYNEEVGNFVQYFKNLLSWNDEANKPGLNNKGEVKNQHIWNAFQKAFQKYKVGSLMVRLSDKGEVLVSNSNFKDVDTQQTERWKIGYKNFLDKKYHKLDLLSFVSLQSKGEISDEQLKENTRKIKTLLDSIGIKLSPLYIEYSILLNKEPSTAKQRELKELYQNFYGILGSDGKNLEVITEFINKKEDLYKEGDLGALTRLKSMAMENASFDETAGSSTFQNAEGELVGDTSLGSFFLKRTDQLQIPQARSEDLDTFTRFYENQEDAWMIPIHHLATLSNPLYKHEETFDKEFIFRNIDGIRPVTYDTKGNEVDTKEGTVFKNMLPLEKILTFMSLYSTTKIKKNKKGEKINYAYYYPQVIEAASTGYAILLPVNNYYDKTYSKEFYNDMLSFIKNEHARIKYVERTELPQVLNFTTKAKNGYKFFVNNWLSEDVQRQLLELDNLSDMSVELKQALKNDIDNYVNKDFQLTLDTLVREGVITLQGNTYTSTLIPKDFREEDKVNLSKLRSMQANYLVNGQALNTLLHGDLAYKIKSPEDHVKRLKGAHGAFTSLYGTEITFKVIPDIISKKEKVIVDGVPQFRTDENGDEHNEADAQGYTHLEFQIERLKQLGKVAPAVSKILDKVKEGKELTRREIDILTDADSLLNPKKDLAYAPNAYIKMSVLTLTRELVSYQKDGEWLALPGREKEHGYLNDMEQGIDLIVHESASKGTTILNEKRVLNGEYYGEQVATKGVKQKITDGTQQLALIWSELPTEIQDLVEDLDAAEQDRLIQSTEFALSLLKDKDVTSLKKVLPNWYNGLVATGASPQLLDIFKPDAEGNPSLNPNISISVAKFTALYLAHWSNNALKQKVAGSKFTLVSPFEVMIDEEDKVVRVDQFKAGVKYNKTRPLAYNKQGTKDGKEILYSECIVSAHFKELYNLKEGDEIPEELSYMLGYRIPTEDKASMVVLKVVDFLPAIYGNAIMVPEEIQYLSGADFDIDSLFVQKYDMYEKDGKFYKYGTATTLEGQFEEYLDYIKRETDVEDYQKTLLEENKEYQNLLLQEKQLTSEIEAKNEKLAEVDDFIPSSLYEESEKESIRSWAIDTKLGLIEKIKQVQERKKVIKANKLATALRYFKLPASKTAFKEKYPDGRFKAVINNELLSLKLEMLGNKEVQKNLASDKTSNEPLLKLEESLRQQFPQTFDTGKSSLSFFSFNDLAVAMSNNDAGSDGIGPAAVFNVVYQYLAKQNVTVLDSNKFRIKINKDKTYSYYQFRGFSPKSSKYLGTNNKRIVKSVSAIISAMTDNAKNPVAAKLNLNTETLGPTLAMIGLGVEKETAIKIINSPSVKELTTKILASKSNFIEESTYSLVNEAKSKVDSINFAKEDTFLDVELLDVYLKEGKNLANTGDLALKIYLNARGISENILLARDILSLRKGVPATFAEVDKITNSYNKLVQNKVAAVSGLDKILDVPSIRSLGKALNDINNTAEELFISQNPQIKETLQIVTAQTKNGESSTVANKIFSDLNSFFSISIFKEYLKTTDKKYKKAFLDAFNKAFTSEELFSKELLKEVEALKTNPDLQNNRFVRYLTTTERENARAVDKIEGNTRQLRDVDYQLELINGFDDLYANPETRNTAIKLFAYILLKDGARYRNASFQSEIPSYMFKIYSDALNKFKENPKMVDLNKLSNEFIKLHSLNTENKDSFLSIPFKSDLYKEGVKQGTISFKEGKLELKEKGDSNFSEVMAAYNFEFDKDLGYKPLPFIRVGKSLVMLTKIDDSPVTDLTDLYYGSEFTYETPAKVLGVDSLNSKVRGVSGYSFPFEEAKNLFKIASKVKPSEQRMSADEWVESQFGVSDFKSTDPTIVAEETVKPKAEPVKTTTLKEASISEQLAEYGVTIKQGMSEFGFATTIVDVAKNADQRIKDIVNRALEEGDYSESSILAKIKEASTNETIKKISECLPAQ